ncbi:DUF5305 family protein [Halorarum salinum]|uniref:DUF5305 domain-containing protein n=1 Tax=Halorarum salinum TaxID=2743089 RepID=A0A7D5LCD7_9EURY|nr:DUF5305 family protein [Halobaculum salinum]QLG63211.1 hypothetical protein HUG12_16315 [Halobaculum salinum]
MIRYPGLARTKLFISDYGRELAAVLAVIGVLFIGGAGWIYAHPPTTTVTDQTNEQTIRSTLHPSAVVTGDSALYRSGERVENQPIYLIAATPNLTLTLETTVPADQPVQVDQHVELVMQAAHNEDAFWQETRDLERSRKSTSNGSVTTSTKINVPQLKEQVRPIENELGRDGSLRVFVRVRTSYETSQYSGTLNRTTPLQLSERSYEIDPLTLERTESTPETREVVVPTRDTSAYAIPAGIGVTALLIAGVVGGLYSRREQWGAVEDQIHQNRYAEWISEGTLSPGIGSQYVQVDSLEDLVDIGIDMGKRVIQDFGKDAYAVIDGEIVYYYGEGTPWPERTSEPMTTDESAKGDERDQNGSSDGNPP